MDYSIVNGDFKDNAGTIQRIHNSLITTFLEHDYVVIDFNFLHKPKIDNPTLSDFWGVYRVEFKIIEKSKYDAIRDNADAQRRNSVSLNPNNSTIFEIEFSKFEYIGQKAEPTLDGYKLYVYTPTMIILEKLRAICANNFLNIKM